MTATITITEVDGRYHVRLDAPPDEHARLVCDLNEVVHSWKWAPDELNVVRVAGHRGPLLAKFCDRASARGVAVAWEGGGDGLALRGGG